MISFLRVTKLYKNNGIREFDCRISRGEIVLLEGPVGAGKSTVLRLLLGATKPDSGRVVVNGTSLIDISTKELAEYRQQIGYVGPLAPLLPDRNLLENVVLPLTVRHKLSRKHMKLRSLDALSKVGLTGLAGRRPSGFSAGEVARASFARALVGEPSLILLDEPLANLDDDSASILISAIANEHQQGALVFIATSHPAMYDSLCARHLRIVDGRLVDDSASSHSAELPLEWNNDA